METCRTCKHPVSINAKTCPNCGEKKPSISTKQMQITSVLALVLVYVAFFYLKSCSENLGKPIQFDLTSSGIKSISYNIDTAEISQGNIYIRINQDPYSGDQGDWNMVASQTSLINSALFSKPDVVKSSIEYWSPQNKVIWATVVLDRSSIPKNWENLTYLQKFSITKHQPSSLQIHQWLCEFYKKYPEAGKCLLN